ncbi:hypothetical protein CYY_000553 [Polysphondylium violaceum]|uniref:Uncharacterized protein n=1 Tax=Polysphondylium violaceum TaxID=133409 RepID=A0A8J4Q3H0_9MYCE|nr:hypothetical protein CYY_000553 [Polysphondylium violaceum]
MMFRKLLKSITPEDYILITNISLISAYGINVIYTGVKNMAKERNFEEGFEHTPIGNHFKSKGYGLASGQTRSILD